MNLFNRKNAELSNTEKVQQAKEQIAISLGVFTTVYADLQEANTVLETVIQEDKALIEATQSNINAAQSELEGNRTLQEKIKIFIKEQ